MRLSLRLAFVAVWISGLAVQAQNAATPAPDASRPWTPLGSAPLDNKSRPLARVEAPDAQIMRLVKDERIWTDRDVRIDEISPGFAGYKFTQLPCHGLTLKFKVLSDGLVYLGCTSRWDAATAKNAGKEFVTEADLLKEGWVREGHSEIQTSSSKVRYLFYSRQCTTGEEFSYRTEKYAPPILLFK